MSARESVLQQGFEGPTAQVLAEKFTHELAERQKEIASAAWLEEARELCKIDLWSMITEALWPSSWNQHYLEGFHRPYAESLDDAEWGSDTWWFWPRNHRKSYIGSVAKIIQDIVRDPDERNMLVGAREDTVTPFAELILSAFLPGTPGFESFQRIYWDYLIEGRTKGRRLRVMTFTHPLRKKTLTDPTFRATYLGVTGAGWRCDNLHLDDCVERRNVTTAEMSMGTLTKILDFVPLVDKTGPSARTYGKGTRWAHHDPYGHLIGEAHDADPAHAEMIERIRSNPRLRVFVRHALEHPSRLCTSCPPHVVERHPHGHPDIKEGVAVADPIWTRRMVLDELDRYLVDMNLGESLWWHQWMNVCVAPGDRKFSENWFLQLNQVSWVAPRRSVLCVDAADKDFQVAGTGDYMVAMMGDWDDAGRLCIRYGLRSNRWTREQFLNRIVAYCQTVNWWPVVVGKEKFGNDNFLSDLGAKIREAGNACHLQPVTRPQDQKRKEDYQIASLQAPMERGGIVFGGNCPIEIVSRARYELTSIGQVANDDVADTLALFFDPELRPKNVDRIANRGNNWTTPNLSNYGIAPRTALTSTGAVKPKNEIEALLTAPSIVAALQEEKPTVISGRPRPVNITPTWIRGL